MCGKTTVLRDLVRRISTGIEKIEFKGINVGIADERGEIAAMYKGVPQNDVGIRTDVLDNIPKAIGMTMLIRSMSPKVIVADEIGKEEEISAINYAVCSGIKGIFTAHAGTLQEVFQNINLKRLIELKLIWKVIVLNAKEKGKIKEVFDVLK